LRRQVWPTCARRNSSSSRTWRSSLHRYRIQLIGWQERSCLWRRRATRHHTGAVLPPGEDGAAATVRRIRRCTMRRRELSVLPMPGAYVSRGADADVRSLPPGRLLAWTKLSRCRRGSVRCRRGPVGPPGKTICAIAIRN
jgi:hypothetical protein